MSLVLASPVKIAPGITQACPLRCLHCNADHAERPKPSGLDLPAWLRTVDELVAGGVIRFYIEGGDSLANAGSLYLLARYARNAPALLCTHGPLTDEPVFEAAGHPGGAGPADA